MIEPVIVPTAISATISGCVAAIVSALVAVIKTQGRKARERDEQAEAESCAIRAAMRALLWREIKTFHESATEKGGLSIEQRRHLEDVYQAYHALGGNGTGTRLYDDAMRMPVK